MCMLYSYTFRESEKAIHYGKIVTWGNVGKCYIVLILTLKGIKLF